MYRIRLQFDRRLQTPSSDIVKLSIVGYGDGPLFGKFSLLSTVKTDLKWLFKMLALPEVSVVT